MDRPDDRPTRHRRGARVLVCSQGRVLLMADSDPGVEGSGWWVTPGGGIDPGETSSQAAARELLEETGHRVASDELDGPVAHRVVTHGYSDRILVQDEEFWRLNVPEPFEVSIAGLTERERGRMGQWGWFSPDEMAAMTVWPSQLPDLLTPGPGCRELGEVEESTVSLPGAARA